MKISIALNDIKEEYDYLSDIEHEKRFGCPKKVLDEFLSAEHSHAKKMFIIKSFASRGRRTLAINLLSRYLNDYYPTSFKCLNAASLLCFMAILMTPESMTGGSSYNLYSIPVILIFIGFCLRRLTNRKLKRETLKEIDEKFFAQLRWRAEARRKGLIII